MKNTLLTFLAVVFCLQASGQSLNSESERPNIKFKAIAELGYLGVIDHYVQFSQSGTKFNYREQGGQDVLFPVSRLSLEMEYNQKNTIYLLYQPLRLETQVLLDEDLIVDDLLFPANTGVKLLYNFPFYRISYSRKVVSKPNKFELDIGGSLQLRNATISFESNDGSLFRTNRDLGPVPAFKAKARYYFNPSIFTELEADGIYAPISYLNGSDSEVKGAILDASLRAGVKLEKPVTAFFNLRYLGGGAVGTSEDEPGPGDGYVNNWLHFTTVTVGFSYSFSAGE